VNNINNSMHIHIRCADKHGEIGTFLVSQKTGKQFGETYKSLSSLLLGNEIKFCKSHGIKLLFPGSR